MYLPFQRRWELGDSNSQEGNKKYFDLKKLLMERLPAVNIPAFLNF